MKNKERDYALDFLKIVATVLVVLHHYQQNTGTRFTEGINFYGGSLPFYDVVELFFLLSGYFMLSYGEKIQKGLSFKAFYGKRMMRLLPMVAVTTVTAEVLLWVYRAVYGSNFLIYSPSLLALLCDCLGVRTGWVFFMSGANGPTWYISVLLLCCLVFYLVNYLSARWSIPAPFFYAGMVLLGLGVAISEWSEPFLNWYAARGYYSFFAGVLLAGLLRGRKIKAPLVIAALASLAVFATYAVCDYSTIENDMAYLLTFLVYPALVILCETEFAKKVFSAGFWGQLSAISFDVYLWHVPMIVGIYVFMRLSGIYFDFSQRQNMFIFLLLAEIVGAVSHYCIEKPLNKAIERLVAKYNLIPEKTV